MISKEEVEHIAKLARIGLSEEEKIKFQKELSLILDYFNLLKKVDVSKVKPTPFAVSSSESYGREDKAEKENPGKTKKLIDAVPEKEEDFVKVKAVF
jgi:aspartyl-tRNA(Asn)/glutamyl-tRNA(Gln) amidotransferase subunit C